MTEWFNNNWFSIVTFVTGCVVSFLASYIFRNKKAINILTVHSEVIMKTQSNLPGIEIKYYGKPVESLMKTTFYIWNSGNSIISKDDIPEHDALRLDADPDFICLVDSETLITGRAACNTKLNLVKPTFYIAFDFWDKKDGISFSVIHNMKKPPIICGVIRGTRIEHIMNGERKQSDILLPLLTIGLSFVLFILSNMIYTIIQLPSKNIKTTASFYQVYVFAILALMCLFFLVRVRSKRKYPKILSTKQIADKTKGELLKKIRSIFLNNK